MCLCMPIIFVVGADHKLCLWDVGTGEILAELEIRDIIFSISFNNVGSKLVTACKDKSIRIHNARTLEVLKVSGNMFVYSVKYVSCAFVSVCCIKVLNKQT